MDLPDTVWREVEPPKVRDQPSELLELILTHIDVWQANQTQLLAALRYCESGG